MSELLLAIAMVETGLKLVEKLSTKLPDDIPPEKLTELNERIKKITASVQAAVDKQLNP